MLCKSADYGTRYVGTESVIHRRIFLIVKRCAFIARQRFVYVSLRVIVSVTKASGRGNDYGVIDDYRREIALHLRHVGQHIVAPACEFSRLSCVSWEKPAGQRGRALGSIRWRNAERREKVEEEDLEPATLLSRHYFYPVRVQHAPIQSTSY